MGIANEFSLVRPNGQQVLITDAPNLEGPGGETDRLYHAWMTFPEDFKNIDQEFKNQIIQQGRINQYALAYQKQHYGGVDDIQSTFWRSLHLLGRGFKELIPNIGSGAIQIAALLERRLFLPTYNKRYWEEYDKLRQQGETKFGAYKKAGDIVYEKALNEEYPELAKEGAESDLMLYAIKYWTAHHPRYYDPSWIEDPKNWRYLTHSSQEAQSWYEYLNPKKGIPAVAANLPQTLGSMLAVLYGGPVGIELSFLGMAGSEAGSVMATKGYKDLSSTIKYGLTAAAIEQGLDVVTAGAAGLFGKLLPESKLAAAFATENLDMLLDALKLPKSSATRTLLRYGLSAMSEGAEGGLQQVAQNFLVEDTPKSFTDYIYDFYNAGMSEGLIALGTMPLLNLGANLITRGPNSAKVAENVINYLRTNGVPNDRLTALRDIINSSDLREDPTKLLDFLNQLADEFDLDRKQFGEVAGKVDISETDPQARLDTFKILNPELEQALRPTYDDPNKKSTSLLGQFAEGKLTLKDIYDKVFAALHGMDADLDAEEIKGLRKHVFALTQFIERPAFNLDPNKRLTDDVYVSLSEALRLKGFDSNYISAIFKFLETTIYGIAKANGYENAKDFLTGPEGVHFTIATAEQINNILSQIMPTEPTSDVHGFFYRKGISRTVLDRTFFNGRLLVHEMLHGFFKLLPNDHPIVGALAEYVLHDPNALKQLVQDGQSVTMAELKNKIAQVLQNPTHPLHEDTVRILEGAIYNPDTLKLGISDSAKSIINAIQTFAKDEGKYPPLHLAPTEKLQSAVNYILTDLDTGELQDLSNYIASKKPSAAPTTTPSSPVITQKGSPTNPVPPHSSRQPLAAAIPTHVPLGPTTPPPSTPTTPQPTSTTPTTVGTFPKSENIPYLIGELEDIVKQGTSGDELKRIVKEFKDLIGSLPSDSTTGRLLSLLNELSDNANNEEGRLAVLGKLKALRDSYGSTSPIEINLGALNGTLEKINGMVDAVTEEFTRGTFRDLVNTWRDTLSLVQNVLAAMHSGNITDEQVQRIAKAVAEYLDIDKVVEGKLKGLKIENSATPNSVHVDSDTVDGNTVNAVDNGNMIVNGTANNLLDDLIRGNIANALETLDTAIKQGIANQTGGSQEYINALTELRNSIIERQKELRKVKKRTLTNIIKSINTASTKVEAALKKPKATGRRYVERLSEKIAELKRLAAYNDIDEEAKSLIDDTISHGTELLEAYEQTFKSEPPPTPVTSPPPPPVPESPPTPVEEGKYTFDDSDKDLLTVEGINKRVKIYQDLYATDKRSLKHTDMAQFLNAIVNAFIVHGMGNDPLGSAVRRAFNEYNTFASSLNMPLISRQQLENRANAMKVYVRQRGNNVLLSSYGRTPSKIRVRYVPTANDKMLMTEKGIRSIYTDMLAGTGADAALIIKTAFENYARAIALNDYMDASLDKIIKEEFLKFNTLLYSMGRNSISEDELLKRAYEIKLTILSPTAVFDDAEASDSADNDNRLKTVEGVDAIIPEDVMNDHSKLTPEMQQKICNQIVRAIALNGVNDNPIGHAIINVVNNLNRILQTIRKGQFVTLGELMRQAEELRVKIVAQSAPPIEPTPPRTSTANVEEGKNLINKIAGETRDEYARTKTLAKTQLDLWQNFIAQFAQAFGIDHEFVTQAINDYNSFMDELGATNFKITIDTIKFMVDGMNAEDSSTSTDESTPTLSAEDQKLKTIEGIEKATLPTASTPTPSTPTPTPTPSTPTPRNTTKLYKTVTEDYYVAITEAFEDEKPPKANDLAKWRDNIIEALNIFGASGTDKGDGVRYIAERFNELVTKFYSHKPELLIEYKTTGSVTNKLEPVTKAMEKEAGVPPSKSKKKKQSTTTTPPSSLPTGTPQTFKPKTTPTSTPTSTVEERTVENADKTVNEESDLTYGDVDDITTSIGFAMDERSIKARANELIVHLEQHLNKHGVSFKKNNKYTIPITIHPSLPKVYVSAEGVAKDNANRLKELNRALRKSKAVQSLIDWADKLQTGAPDADFLDDIRFQIRNAINRINEIFERHPLIGSDAMIDKINLIISGAYDKSDDTDIDGLVNLFKAYRTLQNFYGESLKPLTPVYKHIPRPNVGNLVQRTVHELNALRVLKTEKEYEHEIIKAAAKAKKKISEGMLPLFDVDALANPESKVGKDWFKHLVANIRFVKIRPKLRSGEPSAINSDVTKLERQLSTSTNVAARNKALIGLLELYRGLRMSLKNDYGDIIQLLSKFTIEDLMPDEYDFYPKNPNARTLLDELYPEGYHITQVYNKANNYLELIQIQARIENILTSVRPLYGNADILNLKGYVEYSPITKTRVNPAAVTYQGSDFTLDKFDELSQDKKDVINNFTTELRSHIGDAINPDDLKLITYRLVVHPRGPDINVDDLSEIDKFANQVRKFSDQVERVINRLNPGIEAQRGTYNTLRMLADNFNATMKAYYDFDPDVEGERRNQAELMEFESKSQTLEELSQLPAIDEIQDASLQAINAFSALVRSYLDHNKRFVPTALPFFRELVNSVNILYNIGNENPANQEDVDKTIEILDSMFKRRSSTVYGLLPPMKRLSYTYDDVYNVFSLIKKLSKSTKEVNKHLVSRIIRYTSGMSSEYVTNTTKGIATYRRLDRLVSQLEKQADVLRTHAEYGNHEAVKPLKILRNIIDYLTKLNIFVIDALVPGVQLSPLQTPLRPFKRTINDVKTIVTESESALTDELIKHAKHVDYDEELPALGPVHDYLEGVRVIKPAVKTLSYIPETPQQHVPINYYQSTYTRTSLAKMVREAHYKSMRKKTKLNLTYPLAVEAIDRHNMMYPLPPGHYRFFALFSNVDPNYYGVFMNQALFTSTLTLFMKSKKSLRIGAIDLNLDQIKVLLKYNSVERFRIDTRKLGIPIQEIIVNANEKNVKKLLKSCNVKEITDDNFDDALKFMYKYIEPVESSPDTVLLSPETIDNMVRATYDAIKNIQSETERARQVGIFLNYCKSIPQMRASLEKVLSTENDVAFAIGFPGYEEDFRNMELNYARFALTKLPYYIHRLIGPTKLESTQGYRTRYGNHFMRDVLQFISNKWFKINKSVQTPTNLLNMISGENLPTAARELFKQFTIEINPNIEQPYIVSNNYVIAKSYNAVENFVRRALIDNQPITPYTVSLDRARKSYATVPINMQRIMKLKVPSEDTLTMYELVNYMDLDSKEQDIALGSLRYYDNISRPILAHITRILEERDEILDYLRTARDVDLQNMMLDKLNLYNYLLAAMYRAHMIQKGYIGPFWSNTIIDESTEGFKVYTSDGGLVLYANYPHTTMPIADVVKRIDCQANDVPTIDAFYVDLTSALYVEDFNAFADPHYLDKYNQIHDTRHTALVYASPKTVVIKVYDADAVKYAEPYNTLTLDIWNNEPNIIDVSSEENQRGAIASGIIGFAKEEDMRKKRIVERLLEEANVRGIDAAHVLTLSPMSAVSYIVLAKQNQEFADRLTAISSDQSLSDSQKAILTLQLSERSESLRDKMFSVASDAGRTLRLHQMEITGNLVKEFAINLRNLLKQNNLSSAHGEAILGLSRQMTVADWALLMDTLTKLKSQKAHVRLGDLTNLLVKAVNNNVRLNYIQKQVLSQLAYGNINERTIAEALLVLDRTASWRTLVSSYIYGMSMSNPEGRINDLRSNLYNYLYNLYIKKFGDATVDMLTVTAKRLMGNKDVQRKHFYRQLLVFPFHELGTGISEAFRTMFWKIDRLERDTKYHEEFASGILLTDVWLKHGGPFRRNAAKALTLFTNMASAMDILVKCLAISTYTRQQFKAYQYHKKHGTVQPFQEQYVELIADMSRPESETERQELIDLYKTKSLGELFVTGSILFANKVTFQEHIEPLIRHIMEFRDWFDDKLIRYAKIPIPLARLRLPFIPVAWNMVKFGIRHTPALGLIPGAGPYISPLGILLGVGGSRILLNDSLSDIAVQQLLGMMGTYFIASMLQTGFLTGAPPDDDRQRELERAAGVKYFSFGFQTGDGKMHYVPIPEPLNFAFIPVISEIQYHMYKERDDYGSSDHVADILNLYRNVYRNLFQNTVIGDLLQFNMEYADPIKTQDIPKMMELFLPYNGLFRFINSVNRDYLNEAKTFDTSYDIRDILNDPAKAARIAIGEVYGNNFIALFNDWIPGFENGIPERLTVFGESYGKDRLMTDFLGGKIPIEWIPGIPHVEEGDLDDVERELLRLRLYPRLPDRTITTLKQTHYMTDEQYRDYCLMYGRALKELYSQVMATPKYQQLNQYGKYYLLTELTDRVAQQARIKILERYPEILKSQVVSFVKNLPYSLMNTKGEIPKEPTITFGDIFQK